MEIGRQLLPVCFALVAGCTGASGNGDTDEDTGGPPVDGLGCDAPPSCDRGQLVGSARITTPEQMDDIAGYTSVTGWLEVFETEAQCVDFLACVEEVGHDVTIYGNPNLATLTGLDALESIGTFDDGNIIIGSNHALEDFDGFNGLETIPGSLSIREHDALERVSGLQNLETIGIDITIQQNPVLAELPGLHELLRVLGRFIVTQNPELCISEIETVGADLTEGPNGGSTASNKDC